MFRKVFSVGVAVTVAVVDVVDELEFPSVALSTKLSDHHNLMLEKSLLNSNLDVKFRGICLLN